MARPELVLLTGGSGHIGFRTLRQALEAGYAVRAVVRSAQKSAAIRNNPALSHIPDLDSRLTFVEVPDFLAPNAFDEAVKGVQHIVHVASPLMWSVGNEDLEDTMVKPAVQGTLAVLESAKKAGGVKKVVVTSSAVALIPTAVLRGVETTDKVFRVEDRAESIPPPYPHPMIAYVASKIAALKEAEAWTAREKPEFDVIHIHPSYVGGRDDQTRSLADFKSGTNAYMISSVLGQSDSNPRLATYVHVDDVAEAHIGSLSPSISGHQSFALTNHGGEATWDDAKEIVAKHFPDAVQKGLLPNNGMQAGAYAYSDIRKTEEAFGKLKSFEDIVVSVAGHYLELLEKEG